MSGNVGSDISNSSMVANVGVAVGIASPSVSVQKLFPLPVSTSGFVAGISVSDVGQCRVSALPYPSWEWSKMWGWNSLESLHHQFAFKSYFHFRFRCRRFSFRGRTMLGCVIRAISKLGMVENVGYPLESLRDLFPFKIYFHFRFRGRHLSYRWRSMSFFRDWQLPSFSPILSDCLTGS